LAKRDRDGDDHATVIDEALGDELASKLREIRKEMAEKTAFVSSPPTFDDEDPRTVPELGGRLGSVIPVHNPDEVDNTERSELPKLRRVSMAPPSVEPARGEHTRKEPIPMDLFFERELPKPLPKSARPPAPNFVRAKSVQEKTPKPAQEKKKHAIEEPTESAEQTMLDVAAAVGVAPVASKSLPPPEEDTFDDVKDKPEASTDAPKLSLPSPEQPQLDLTPFVEGEQAKQIARAPREGMGTDDIRIYAATAETSSKIIPIVLAAFVVVATLYAMIGLFHSTADRHEEHVELRFLATLNGKQTQLVTRDGAKLVRIQIETVPPEILILHNREILGKTPLTVDLPIELGEVIGVELSSPYYQTWINEVRQDPTGEEYRIHAELTKK
jgi:hypothetical protein